MRRVLAITSALAALSVLLGGVACAEENWINLFNGKDLGNWEVKGGKATYRIEGDAIVGTSAPNTENSFLCSKEEFKDFVLEFEFLGHPNLNSGVQIRSESLADYKNFRVHGYQVELEDEAKDRDWSGGIYDEARRGWLYPLEADKDKEPAKEFSEQGKAVWKNGDWNKVRVEAKGDSIKTWVNGEPRADLKDNMTPEGFIALQVHSVGGKTEPLSVRWRNIRLMKLDGAPAAK
ncbi:MAG: DUF1080 domain-containing protein [Candidatus Hydrogenedentes bacterium]|nr:DUF1080 domain-containing protein [Candidatus Hydrogenedentota bacterium]